jgi:gamma-glutamylcyclotransferase (GGCT)/AIG2-like uncharacterized protein YtfP
MLFAYGTLQHPRVLSALLQGRVLLPEAMSAVIPGLRVVPIRGVYYPAAIPAEDQKAKGVLWDITLSTQELEILDRWEGDEYTRTTMTVTCQQRQVEAQVYLYTGPSDRLDMQGQWSLDEFYDNLPLVSSIVQSIAMMNCLDEPPKSTDSSGPST